MLRVLLIGNGFDLAHGAPTGFLDFAKHIKENILIPELNKDNKYLYSRFDSSIITKNRRQFRNESTVLGFKNVLELDENERKEIFTKQWSLVIPHLKNKLLSRLYIEQVENWFDVESTYFRSLVEIYDKNKDDKSHDASRATRKSLVELNRNLNQIRIYLIEYLKNIDIKANKKIGQFLTRLLRDEKGEINELFIIDFNYTKTIHKYSFLHKVPISYVDIHGSLDIDVVFGYGNDKDDEYQAIKKTDEDEFLQNFKTQKYLLRREYQSIIKYLIDTKLNYEVDVVGHSLGLTDKTLLHELFNTKNCLKINIYKRRDLVDDGISESQNQIRVQKAFTRLTMAATRIIDDELARNKITNFEDADYFP